MRLVAATGSLASMVLMACVAVRPFIDEVVAGLPAVSAATAEEPVLRLEELYRHFRNQSAACLKLQLYWMWAAAGEGDDFYRTDVEVSADCRRTGQASMRSFLAFDTLDETDRLVTDVMKAAVERIADRTQSTTVHPFELFCAELDQRMRANSQLASAYVAFKTILQRAGAKANRTYYYAHFVPEPTAAVQLFVPGTAEITLCELFKEQLDARNAFDERSYVLASAIVAVARTEARRRKVELIRERVIQQLVADFTRNRKFPCAILRADTKALAKQMMAAIERHFDQDADLRVELRRAKDAILRAR